MKKKQIIEAAMAVLYERGFCDMKIKDVALKADVSAGLVCHHFETKKGLLLASMEYAVSLYGQRLQQLGGRGIPPRKAVLSIVQMALDPSQFGKELSATWLALYYLAACDDDFDACLEAYKQRSFDTLLSLTGQIYDEEIAVKHARTVTSLIDGFWLQNCSRTHGRKPRRSTNTMDQAVAIVDQLLSPPVTVADT
ncbi:TetR family transcriptional regulator [Leisingera sp. ANG-Vp]|uniref:TetR family transcriptional regulator n=1 Tax=Leisingera sp. ANG-Vp TaxID=1577896 RepID=UPI00057EB85A|nr:TetR family transcriptional regulator [Leisingera sp. ANG-Vp]KIC14342.1 hypothetical protein RA20_20920 [Leisingera sp. ANG-Vp]